MNLFLSTSRKDSYYGNQYKVSGPKFQTTMADKGLVFSGFPVWECMISSLSGISGELKKISGHEIFIYNCSPRSIDTR